MSDTSNSNGGGNSSSTLITIGQNIVTAINGLSQALTLLSGQGGAWTSYTPSLSANSGTFTSATATGLFVQIGKTVFFSIEISITTNGSAAGWINVSLPSAPVGTVQAAGEIFNTGQMISGLNVASVLEVTRYDGAYPGANGYDMVINGFYQVS